MKWKCVFIGKNCTLYTVFVKDMMIHQFVKRYNRFIPVSISKCITYYTITIQRGEEAIAADRKIIASVGGARSAVEAAGTLAGRDVSSFIQSEWSYTAA